MHLSNRFWIVLAFSVALSLSGIFIILILAVFFSKHSPIGDNGFSLGYILLAFFLMLACYSYLLFMGLRILSRRQIQSIYKFFPQLEFKSDKELNVKSLTQKILNLNKIQSKEIDLLKERVDYRREFLGNISHELKTPIFSIQGFTLTLIEGGKENEELLARYLNRINKSVERMTYIVNDLDTIAALENKKTNMQSFNIVAVAQEVMDLLEIEAEKKNVKLQFDVLYEVPILVNGDLQQISQVFVNLIENAISYGGENTLVTVSFENRKNERIQIKIHDTGQGIPEDKLDRIFERFYRVDLSRNRRYGGSGLGLAIVKHILEAHYSKVIAKSNLEEGTSFSFELDLI